MDSLTCVCCGETLFEHFDSVYLARTCEEVRPAVARHRAEALVLDLETSGPDEARRWLSFGQRRSSGCAQNRSGASFSRRIVITCASAHFLFCCAGVAEKLGGKIAVMRRANFHGTKRTGPLSCASVAPAQQLPPENSMKCLCTSGCRLQCVRV
jgi:hypothetical protein